MEWRSEEFEEQTKWKMMFCGHDECWRTERIAAMEPRMYVVSNVIATWTASSEQIYVSVSCSVSVSDDSVMVAQFGEL